MKEVRRKKKLIEHWNVIAIYMMVYDIITVNLAYFLALFFRFDCVFSHIPLEYLYSWLKMVPIYTVVCIVVFWLIRLYQGMWRFAGYSELLRVTWATVITAVIHTVGVTALFQRMPISYYIIGPCFQFAMTLVVRFAYRFILLERSRRSPKGINASSNIMLVGAGDAGQVILRELQRSNNSKGRVCCIIDDNPNKWGRYIEGVKIVGGRDSILASVSEYKIGQILFAIPGATAQQRRDILNICNEANCDLKTVPSIGQIVDGNVTLSDMKEVAVEDLLGREPIKVDMKEIFSNITGKKILVTGGGGSIGSELCRQIAGHGPKKLIIFEIYENNAYDIEQELRRHYPYLDLVVLIGSVRDSRRLKQVFETYKPDVVFHAAAHKHVPLMETSPCEAIKNNVVGTYKTAFAALSNHCRRFILISTDKAVNPTNVMGASKRLCEMIIQSMDVVSREGRMDLLPHLHAHTNLEEHEKYMDPMDEIFDQEISDETNDNHVRTEFVAVRFGNVLGSNGSVIPLFKKQIAAGGPVTVTHPDIIRYFMTIPEAVSLVLQAGVYAKGGEIFVFDMGEPVKIDTLAKNLIKLSGHRPGVDIEIAYTGLRPGEKLYEETLMEAEGLKTTPNKLIHIGEPIPMDIKEFLKQLEDLAVASYCNSESIVEMVQAMVPTFHPDGDREIQNR